MHRSTLLVSLVLVLGCQSLAAQEEAAEAERSSEATAILQALELPRAAQILRERGVPVEEIEAAIAGARERAVSPGEMTGVFGETAESVEENGPIENFGAFVQEQLDAGLRGRELAESIRAEHARRGIGQGRTLESRRGPPEGRGPEGGPDQRGGPPDSVRGGGPPDSVRDGPPGNRRGGPPDTTRGDGGGGDVETRGQGKGGQR